VSEEQISLFGEEPHPPAATPLVDVAQIPTRASLPIPPGTFASLDELSSLCNGCQRCDLAVGRTHVVISRGNPTASLMIIGEGPGENEDLQGQPFVGKAGQLLDKILASVGLDSNQDAFICNIVKCRPPGNRKPTPEEMAACVPWLHEQIRLVDPKIILLAGATAVQGLIGDKRGITKIRGEWMVWNGYACLPVFHPAYLLRNPSREKGSPKWLMWQDIQAVKQRLDALT
jgi:DNA polymerase